jgi:membrane-associated phospholipid phosphatase
VDRSLYKAINRFADRTSWAHGFFRLYAKDGVVLLALLLVVGWWLGRNREPSVSGVGAAVWAGAGALLALAINQPIGAAVSRARPYTVIPNMHLLVDKTSDFSFPSDHATVAGAVAAGLWLVNRRLGLVAAVAAIVMAFARVYVGAHYVGDVVAGLLLGAIVTLALSRIAAKVIEPILRALMKTPLRPLVTGDPATS